MHDERKADASIMSLQLPATGMSALACLHCIMGHSSIHITFRFATLYRYIEQDQTEMFEEKTYAARNSFDLSVVQHDRSMMDGAPRSTFPALAPLAVDKASFTVSWRIHKIETAQDKAASLQQQ